MIDNHIIQFGEFLASIKNKLSPGQLKYAKKILEDILDSMSYIENVKAKLEKELSGQKNQDYPSVFQKAMDLIVLTGFDVIEFTETFNIERIEFMHNNIESIKKSGELTAKRITNICLMIRYYEQTTGEFPKSMGELIESYNEIKKLRNDKE